MRLLCVRAIQPRSDDCQPVFILTILGKMVYVPLDNESSLLEDLPEAETEAAVGEEDNAQAARS